MWLNGWIFHEGCFTYDGYPTKGAAPVSHGLDWQEKESIVLA
jgi:hypothetical protein